MSKSNGPTLHVTLGALALMGGLTLASSAAATPDLPRAVADHLDMPCTPRCIICHQTDKGGPGMLNEGGFVSALLGYGLDPQNTSSVGPALDAAEFMMEDRDGDMILDVQELRDGTGPNDQTNTVDICAADIEYGCFARIAPAPASRDSLAGAAAALTALGLIAAARRRFGS
jgi:hypothetical protein